MGISRAVWEQTQYGLIDDFVDLFLPPAYQIAVEADYPLSPAMGPLTESLLPSIEFPDVKLLRLEQYWDKPGVDVFERSLPDWAIVFAFELLEAFGHRAASNLRRPEFEGLRQLANIWGMYLAHEYQRVFHRFEFFTSWLDLAADLLLLIRQFPPKELGEVIRESATPAYVRAGQIAAYQMALLNADWAGMRESQIIIQASDGEIQRGIVSYFSGYSAEEIGRHLQRLTIEFVSMSKELLSSEWFKQHYFDLWPILARHISWIVGYRLRQNIERDPARVGRLLEAIGRFGEIAAAIEQYRFRYGWRGDVNRAIAMGWQAVAPKRFHISRDIQEIHQDEEQEMLIGLGQGLRDYTERNSATVAVRDGFLGKLGAYLEMAAKNQEKDYIRKQSTDGNIILTEAQHAEDFRHTDTEEGNGGSDEEILSQQKEKHYPQGNPVLEGLELQDTLREWGKALTDKERTAVELMHHFGNQQKVAEVMGISQPAVSQLLNAARRKYPKISR